MDLVIKSFEIAFGIGCAAWLHYLTYRVYVAAGVALVNRQRLAEVRAAADPYRNMR